MKKLKTLLILALMSLGIASYGQDWMEDVREYLNGQELTVTVTCLMEGSLKITDNSGHIYSEKTTRIGPDTIVAILPPGNYGTLELVLTNQDDISQGQLLKTRTIEKSNWEWAFKILSNAVPNKEGKPPTWYYQLKVPCDDAFIVIYDSGLRPVDKIEIGPKSAGEYRQIISESTLGNLKGGKHYGRLFVIVNGNIVFQEIRDLHIL